MKKILLYLLFTATVFAQQKQVMTSIDTTKNKIGAEFKLSFTALVAPNAKVVFPTSKNFGALEVIESYPVDTIKKNDRLELVKKYGLTQFDSGRYKIPSVKILINNKAFLSDSVLVEVTNVKVDTLKQKMYDIKDITSVKTPMGNWWKYLLGFLFLIALGYAIYKFIQNKKQNKEQEDTYKTPIEKATNLLNTLEKKELWQKGEVKEYYSELTTIVRNYIEEAIEIPAMESTTSELIEGLKLASRKKKMKLSAETFNSLQDVLKQADLVKFAKSKPLDFEITDDRKKLEKAIITIEKAIPKAVEVENENLLNEMQRQEQLKKELALRKKKRLTTTIAVLAGVFVATTLFFIITKGFDTVVDTVFRHPTKRLLENEWIQSEYGNPSIKITTPEVLVRTDLKKTLPQDGLALIKDMQSFVYGGLADNLYILLSTIQYKQESQIELPKALDGALQALEAQGAQNMIVKQEDFETNEGNIKGIKGYGTFSKLDAENKTSAKFYYETLIFSQQGGLQQIIIVYEEGDKYATQISEKIIQSVELQNTQQ